MVNPSCTLPCIRTPDSCTLTTDLYHLLNGTNLRQTMIDIWYFEMIYIVFLPDSVGESLKPFHLTIRFYNIRHLFMRIFILILCFYSSFQGATFLPVGNAGCTHLIVEHSATEIPTDVSFKNVQVVKQEVKFLILFKKGMTSCISSGKFSSTFPFWILLHLTYFNEWWWINVFYWVSYALSDVFCSGFGPAFKSMLEQMKACISSTCV